MYTMDKNTISFYLKCISEKQLKMFINNTFH